MKAEEIALLIKLRSEKVEWKNQSMIKFGKQTQCLRKVAVGKKERAKETNYYKVYTKKQITLIFEENG